MHALKIINRFLSSDHEHATRRTMCEVLNITKQALSEIINGNKRLSATKYELLASIFGDGIGVRAIEQVMYECQLTVIRDFRRKHFKTTLKHAMDKEVFSILIEQSPSEWEQIMRASDQEKRHYAEQQWEPFARWADMKQYKFKKVRGPEDLIAVVDEWLFFMGECIAVLGGSTTWKEYYG